MIARYGFFSRFMTEPAPVATSRDVPTASGAAERTQEVPIIAPRPGIPWQRYPSAVRAPVPTMDVAPMAIPARERTRAASPGAIPAGLNSGITMPARPMYRPMVPGRSPGPMPRLTPRAAGTTQSDTGGGLFVPAKDRLGPRGSLIVDSRDSGGGGTAGGGATGGDTTGGGVDFSAATDDQLRAYMDAAASGTLPADLQQFLPGVLAEARKRGLAIPAGLVGTSKSDTDGQVKAGGGIGLLLAGAGAGFLVGGPVGAAVGAAAGLLLGRK